LAVTAADRADVANFSSWVAALEGQPDRERAFLTEALPLAEEAGGPCLIRTLIGLVWWSPILANSLPPNGTWRER
jgi:hypothetical protein